MGRHRRQKGGQPKRASRFICLRCLKENRVGAGIQRGNQREPDHIKDLPCLCTQLQERTKNLEVRFCDNFAEKMKKANILRQQYYME